MFQSKGVDSLRVPNSTFGVTENSLDRVTSSHYALTRRKGGTSQRQFKFVQHVGDDRFFVVTDKDKRIFAEFHGKLAG